MIYNNIDVKWFCRVYVYEKLISLNSIHRLIRKWKWKFYRKFLYSI